jgi:hypothetical protein
VGASRRDSRSPALPGHHGRASSEDAMLTLKTGIVLSLVGLGLVAAGCGGNAPTAEPPRAKEELPPKGALVAGIAEVKVPAPVGIGTMGYSPIGQEKSVTPFAEGIPGTTRQHGALTFKAVALSRGPGHEVILVRTDTIGIFQQLRQAVLDELRRRTQRDLDDALVLAGNHTHSGPGRLLMADGALTILADKFLPELYERIVGALADVVEQALADQKPAEIGWTMGASSEAHKDRRCENDPLDQVQEKPDLPIVVIRRGGTIDAVVASYAYHGTVLGIADLTLSGDMGSVVEHKIQERLDHPVSVLFLNSWGADMSPGSPPLVPEEEASPQPSGFARMEGLGVMLADVVVPKLAEVSFEADPEVRARTYRVQLDRDALGYDEDTFYYPNGGVFCGLGAGGNCTDRTPIAGLDRICIGFTEDEPAPKQTLFTTGTIGSLAFVTGQGEWSTHLANGVLDRMRAKSGGEAMFIGYANDFTGYSLNEDDWWQGGYEAGGALWGPRQGDYLAERASESFETFFDTFAEPPFEQPEPLPAFSGYQVSRYVVETARAVGTIAADVPSTVSRYDVVTFVVDGADPWLGTPVATLEHEGPNGFEPVRKSNGAAVDSDGYDLWIDLAVEPPYTEAAPAEGRRFAWAVHFPVTRRAATTIPTLEGPHRLSVRLPTDDAGGEMVVGSAAFVVNP